MAFKREGNDKSLLNILQRRRISELLVNDIPEDEALLLSNGRFACTVCGYRPVFDTVTMLAVHRQGKKHASYLERKQEAELDKQTCLKKRQHEEWLQSGQVSKTMVSTYKPSKHHSLLTSCEYNARSSRHKLKPYDRKPTLVIESKNSPPVHANQESSDSKLSLFLENGKFKRDAPLTISEFRKVVGLQKEPMQARPYRTPSNTTKGNPVTWTSTPSSHNPPTAVCRQKDKDPDQSGKSGSKEKFVYVHEKYHKSKGRKHKAETVTRSTAEQEKINMTEQYLSFRGAGWKKDLNGKWIKDEDCEFDSDEEPPDLP